MHINGDQSPITGVTPASSFQSVQTATCSPYHYAPMAQTPVDMKMMSDVGQFYPYQESMHYQNYDASFRELLSIKLEQLRTLSAEVSDMLKFGRDIYNVPTTRQASYHHGTCPRESAHMGTTMQDHMLAEALLLHETPPPYFGDNHPVPKQPMKVDGRRVASPVVIRWMQNDTNKEIKIHSSEWSRENLGMVITYYNPIIDGVVYRNFSSRRYKGRSKCEAAAEAFYQKLMQGFLPDDDAQYMGTHFTIPSIARNGPPQTQTEHQKNEELSVAQNQNHSLEHHDHNDVIQLTESQGLLVMDHPQGDLINSEGADDRRILYRTKQEN